VREINIPSQLKILLLLILTVSACQSAQTPAPERVTTNDIVITTVPNPTVEATPYVFSAPVANTATVHGKLVVLDPMVMLPASSDAIYFVPMGEGEGATTIPYFEYGDVPQADVDETTGEFVFTGIQPGRYAVVVETLGGAQIPARDMQSRAIVFVDVMETDLNTTIELGFISLP
jgi:hypothetical protein